MGKQTAELRKWAKNLGCTYLGIAPSGRVQVELPDGSVVTTVAMPRDQHSLRQAQRDIARALGIPVPSTPSAHHRKGTGRRGFSMRAAVAQQRPDRSGIFTVGDRASSSAADGPPALVALRAEESRLASLFATAPTGAIEVQLRNVRARIRNRIY